MKRVSSKAATLIEVVIMLPLFLLGIFFILWIGYVVNTKNSLISAVENGVRLASTRGKAGLYQGAISTGSKSGAMQALDNFTEYELGLDSDYLDLLQYNITAQENFEDLYRSRISEVFSEPLELKELPAYYTYAIAYTNKSMRLSYGDNIKYPCDPKDPATPNNGENCLFCYPANPVTMNSNPLTNENLVRVPDQARDPQKLLETRVAIRCDFKPGGFITSVILRLLSFFSDSRDNNSMVMSHFTYFDSYESCVYENAGSFSRYCCKDFNGDPFCY